MVFDGNRSNAVMLPLRLIRIALSPTTRRALCSLAVATVLATAARAELLVLQSAQSGVGRALVHRVDPATGRFASPFGPDNEALYALAVSATNDVYVAANIAGYGLIHRFDARGRSASILAELPETDVRGLAVAPGGAVFALVSVGADLDSVVRHHRILRLGAAIRPTVLLTEGAGGLDQPTAIAIDPAGDLLVAETKRGVLRFDAVTGAFRGVAVPAGRGGLGAVAALAFDGAGRLYVSDPDMNSVLRFNPHSGDFLGNFVAPGAGGLRGVRGLTFAPDGSLHVCSSGTNAVLRFDGGTGAYLGASATNANLRAPIALAFTQDSPALGDASEVRRLANR